MVLSTATGPVESSQSGDGEDAEHNRNTLLQKLVAVGCPLFTHRNEKRGTKVFRSHFCGGFQWNPGQTGGPYRSQILRIASSPPRPRPASISVLAIML